MFSIDTPCTRTVNAFFEKAVIFMYINFFLFFLFLLNLDIFIAYLYSCVNSGREIDKMEWSEICSFNHNPFQYFITYPFRQ